VRTTTAVAVPLTTWVPIQSALDRRASGVSAGSKAAAFSTGNVSPVSMASSTNRSLDSRSSPSPGTISPAFRMTTSPGTISSTGLSLELPSRRTAALIPHDGKEFLHGVRCAALLPEPEQAADEDDEQNDEASTRSPRNHDSPVRKEDEYDRTLELVEQERPHI